MMNILCEIHNLKSFRAEDNDPGFQEYQIVRLRGKEEILKYV